MLWTPKFAGVMTKIFHKLVKFEQGEIMMPFDKCPVCGGELVEKNETLMTIVNDIVLMCKSVLAAHYGDSITRADLIRICGSLPS